MSEKTEYILTCETDSQAKALIESLIQLLGDIESGKHESNLLRQRVRT